MAGDIEDFLRRAAQRRQQQANQKQAQPAQPPQRSAPQYTDRRRERVRQAVPVQPIMAEIIEEDDEVEAVVATPSLSELRKSREATDRSDLEREQNRFSGGASVSDDAAQIRPGENVNIDLLRLLRSPNGLRQAVLLREILEPRSNFWEK